MLHALKNTHLNYLTPALHSVTIFSQGRPYYEDYILERSLMSYKFYHDLAMDMDYSAFAHGPCWEPTISQVSGHSTMMSLKICNDKINIVMQANHNS